MHIIHLLHQGRFKVHRWRLVPSSPCYSQCRRTQALAVAIKGLYSSSPCCRRFQIYSGHLKIAENQRYKPPPRISFPILSEL